MDSVNIVLCVGSGLVLDLAVFESLEDAEAYTAQVVGDCNIDADDGEYAEDYGNLMYYHSGDYKVEIILYKNEPVRQYAEERVEHD